MRVCPECGDVFSDKSRVCSAHGAALRDWTEMPETHTETGLVTDVDTRRVEDERRFEVIGQAIGEIHAAPLAHGLRGASTGTTPPIVIEGSTQRRRAPHGGRLLGGRYRLGEHIGIGGYGAVFDAVDIHTDERVAVKVLSPAASESVELVTRFHREAIAASRVRHPNIVDVVDFDVDEDGIHFIVMEYLDGVDLAEVLDDEGVLPPARALAIAIRCASALAAAHRAGILHRDLKPSNVFLVERDGEPDFVKIIDFGISKLTRAAGQYSDLTSASRVVGTPCYMSPEQARGEELDGRCDGYGLGIILYEMLTGERPFTGRSAIEILTNHIESPRVPPSAIEPAVAEVPGLDELVVSAIAAERDDRPPSLGAFADSMMAILERIDSEAAAAIRGDRQVSRTLSQAIPRVPPRRRWSFAAAAAALALVAIAIVGVIGLTGDRSDAVPPAPAEPALTAMPGPTAPEPATEPELAADPEPAAPSQPAESDDATEREAAPAPVVRVVRVTSTPTGATVYRGDHELGRTPLDVEVAGGDEPVSLRLRKPGRRSRVIEVDGADDRTHVTLPRVSRAKKRPPKPPVQGIKEW